MSAPLPPLDGVTLHLEGHVGFLTFSRPPENYFDEALLAALCAGLDALESQPDCRAIVLASTGRVFCAGARFGDDPSALTADAAARIYDGAVRLVSGRLPVVAAVQGPAVGGGLGLALIADFRLCAFEARFHANFARLGLHAGFGITALLPRLVGQQKAAEMLLGARRVTGVEALALGLVDRTVPAAELPRAAADFAAGLAGGAPLAVQSMRQTLRGELACTVREATARELAEQARHMQSADFAEGVRAAHDRRAPRFTGH